MASSFGGCRDGGQRASARGTTRVLQVPSISDGKPRCSGSAMTILCRYSADIRTLWLLFGPNNSFDWHGAYEPPLSIYGFIGASRASQKLMSTDTKEASHRSPQPIPFTSYYWGKYFTAKFLGGGRSASRAPQPHRHALAVRSTASAFRASVLLVSYYGWQF